MAIERKPQSGKDDESYPTRAEFAHDRRHFLALLGVGAVTAAGAYAATSNGPPPPQPEPEPPKPHDPPAEPKEPLGGKVKAPVDSDASSTNSGCGQSGADAGSSTEVAQPQQPLPGEPVAPQQTDEPPAVPPRKLAGKPMPPKDPHPKPGDPDASP